MMGTGSVGIVCERATAGWYEEALSEWRTVYLGGSGIYELLDSARAAGYPVVVVDSSAVGESIEEENGLVDWLVDNDGAPRVVLASSDLTSDDPMLYRCVTVGHLDDVVLATLSGDMAAELAHRLEVPGTVSDVSSWVTSDKKAIERPRSGGFASRRGHDGRKRKAEPRTPESVAAEAAAGHPGAGLAPIRKGEPVTRGDGDTASAAHRGPTMAGGPAALGRGDRELGAADIARAKALLSRHAPGSADTEPAGEPGASGAGPFARGAGDSLESAGRDPAVLYDATAAVGGDDAREPRAPATAEVAARAMPAGAEAEVAKQMAVYDALIDMGILSREAKMDVLEREHELRTGRRTRTATEIAREEEKFRAGLAIAGRGTGGQDASEEGGGMGKEKDKAQMEWCRYVAVAGTRPGVGCSHYAFALAMALAGKGLSCALVMSDRRQFLETGRALSPVQAAGKRAFAFRGVEVWFWDDWRGNEEGHDVSVFDCGVLDIDSPAEFGPAAVFKVAALPVLVLSGAPWDEGRVSRLLETYDRKALATWHWAMFGGSKRAADRVSGMLSDALGDRFSGLVRIAYQPNVFEGSPGSWDEYAKVLSPVLPDRVKRKSRGGRAAGKKGAGWVPKKEGAGQCDAAGSAAGGSEGPAPGPSREPESNGAEAHPSGQEP